MKLLKINDDVHKKLKEHLKDEKVFMQEYVERVIEDSIKNNYLYMNLENLISSLEELVTIKKIKGDKYSLHYVDFGSDPSEKYQEFTISASNMDDIIKWYNSTPNAKYFNIVGSNCVTATDTYNEDMNNLPYIEIKSTLKRSITIKLWNYHSIKNEDVVYLLKQKTKNDLEFGDFEDVELMGTLSPKILNKKGVLSDISETFRQDIVNKIKKYCLKNDEHNLEFVIDNNINGDINSNFRKFTSKVLMASNIIAMNGRVGPAHNVLIGEKIFNLILTNQTIDITYVKDPDFTVVGDIGGIKIIYDKSIDGDNIYVYRKNSIDQTNLSVILDETPTLGNIKGAIVDMGLQPHLQFKSIKVLNNISIDESEKDIQETLNKYSFIQKNPNHSKYNLNENKITSLIINTDENIARFNFSKILDDIKHSILKQITNNATELDKVIIGNLGGINRKNINDNILDVIVNNATISGDKNEINIITNFLLGSWMSEMMMDMQVSGLIIDPTVLYYTGTVKHNDVNINVYIDSYMKYTDKRIFIINDVRISYNKNIIRTITKSNDILHYNTLYKIDKDVLSIEIEDNGNFLM